MHTKALAHNYGALICNTKEAWNRMLCLGRKRIKQEKKLFIWRLNAPLTRLNQRVVHVLSHLDQCEALDHEMKQQELDVQRMESEGGAIK